MNLEELMASWKEDSRIDYTNLTNEALRNYELHSKYYDLYVQERARYFKYESELKKLKLDKYEFYTQGPTEETRNLGWRLPAAGRILKTEAQQYIEADDDVIKQQLRVNMQKEKCDYLESIIKTLGGRSFHIKTILEIEKFKAGY